MPSRNFKDRPPPLSFQEEAELARRARSGDVAARDRLVERYLPLAQHVARRFARRWPRFAEDLLGEARCALVQLAADFDPGDSPEDRGRRITVRLSAACLEWLLDHRRLIRVPRYLQQATLRRREADPATVRAADVVLGAAWSPLAPARTRPTVTPSPIEAIIGAEESGIVREELSRLAGSYGVAVRLRHGFTTGEPETLEAISRVLGKRDKSSAKHYHDRGIASLRSGLKQRGITA